MMEFQIPIFQIQFRLSVYHKINLITRNFVASKHRKYFNQRFMLKESQSLIPLSWEELTSVSSRQMDKIDGPTNAQSYLRLFGKSESEVRVTLYRDYAAWCPYCQKVWLWLEEKKIPYRIRKVTMFCYGEKESWYKNIVPSGMLPAIELSGQIMTESDDILIRLETEFGPLGTKSLTHKTSLRLRQLERNLFRAWCEWLCYPSRNATREQDCKLRFEEVMHQVCAALEEMGAGPYFLEDFSAIDIIFIPYLERMNASLYAYKGFDIRESFPVIDRWFSALETRVTYLGTQSDFHTHVHDLPPQMGGCYSNGTIVQRQCMERVNKGPWFGLPDTKGKEGDDVVLEAIHRVVKHRENVMKTNVEEDKNLLDIALRCTLTTMYLQSTARSQEDLCICAPPPGSALGLKYLRGHISVPRDMSIYAAKHLRSCLQLVSSYDSVGRDVEPEDLPTRHRRDQDPLNFRNA